MFLKFVLKFIFVSISIVTFSQTITVPIGGNTFSSLESTSRSRVQNNISDWVSSEEVFTTFVRVSKSGSLSIGVNAAAEGGSCIVSIGINTKRRNITIDDPGLKNYSAGQWKIADTGYIPIVIKAVSKTGAKFARIESLTLSGSAASGVNHFVKNNEGNFYYWGRRGPSTHLNYKLPNNVKAEWFYNEITVPPGSDVSGSYFMANGFGQGYFGIQVNSPTERRILFSVWSPFVTDDPKEIPEDKKIRLVKKGNGVHTGEFGNEGSGGQSFLRYDWKAGSTYRFLLHGVPEGVNHTIFTAYFYSPEEKQWLLIASFKRPDLATYLTNTHSFLENFIPQQGDIERKVFFGNQWIRDHTGKWHELQNARFTADNTARMGYRQDYSGGVEGDRFYLHNFGFFSQFTPIGKNLSRLPLNNHPEINFRDLP